MKEKISGMSKKDRMYLISLIILSVLIIICAIYNLISDSGMKSEELKSELTGTVWTHKSDEGTDILMLTEMGDMFEGTLGSDDYYTEDSVWVSYEFNKKDTITVMNFTGSTDLEKYTGDFPIKLKDDTLEYRNKIYEKDDLEKWNKILYEEDHYRHEESAKENE